MIPDVALPPKLPEYLIYWNRCETRIESQRLVSYTQIQNFQKAAITQFVDTASKEKVMKKFPIIDDLEPW